ncbi:MAG: hypothetical protein ACXAEU_07885 [Candidatus Hodarchaeales archaeon]
MENVFVYQVTVNDAVDHVQYWYMITLIFVQCSLNGHHDMIISFFIFVLNSHLLCVKYYITRI